MASVLFSNNASAALASSITSASTVITVTTGAGAQFPAITGGNYFYATLTDSSNNLEIVKVTARSSDVLTVVRGQEGTTARAYAAADKIELRVTTAALTEYVTLAIADAFAAAKQALYPVGSIYSNATSNTNPSALLGFGTWVSFGSGKVPVGYDATNALFDAGEKTGGSADAVVVSHSHTASSGTESVGHTHSVSGTTNNTTLTGTFPTSANTGSFYSGSFTRGTQYGGNGGEPQTNSEVVFNAPHTHTFSATTGGVSASHTHAITVNAAGSSATNANLQPYITVFMWKRTA